MQESQETGVWSLGWENPLEEEMATQSSYSCLEDPMERGAWLGHKELDMTEWLSTHSQSKTIQPKFVFVVCVI